MDVAVELGNIKLAILLSKYGGKVTRVDNQKYFKQMLDSKMKFLRFGISILPLLMIIFPYIGSSCFLGSLLGEELVGLHYLVLRTIEIVMIPVLIFSLPSSMRTWSDAAKTKLDAFRH